MSKGSTIYNVPSYIDGKEGTNAVASLKNEIKPKLENKNMTKGPSLQDPFLNSLRKEKIPVSIYLVNGIKLQGIIESFDQFVVLLKNTVSQMVYKHAISTIVPARNVSSPFEYNNNGYSNGNGNGGNKNIGNQVKPNPHE